MTMRKPILILSVDGGGVRGVIPVNVLALIESQRGIDVRDSFDFFAGVSTGALVACYCARGFGSMETLAKDIYGAENMSRIFDKTVWDRLLGRMQSKPKYDGLNKRAYFRQMGEDTRINDIADKHLLVLAYDFINRELVTFKNRRGHDASYNPTLEEICDAATAAPTLFPTVPTSGLNRRWLIDGALATNDPSICAITEALTMGHSIADVFVVSLGTGRPVPDLSQQQQDRIGEASQDWGIYGWVKNGLMEHMLSGSSAVSAHQCQALLGNRYLRIDGTLPRSLMRLDETSPQYVSNLQGYATRWFEDYADPPLQLLRRFQEQREIASRAQ
ncbi:MAG: patatin-like phospholipase/acyl hydrolase [Halieaceae bacterium]|jgi:patatin-like phospholipase/acyl hydrolase